MERLLAIPPIVVLFTVAAVYGAALVARASWREVLLAAYVAVIGSLVFLPGGRQVVDHARQLPEADRRVRCVAESAVRGVPWRGAAAIGGVSACGAAGHRLGAAPAGAPDTRAARALRDAF